MYGGRRAAQKIDRVCDLCASAIEAREQICERPEIGCAVHPIEPTALTLPTKVDDLEVVRPGTVERFLRATLAAGRASELSH